MFQSISQIDPLFCIGITVLVHMLLSLKGADEDGHEVSINLTFAVLRERLAYLPSVHVELILKMSYRKS